MPTGSRSPRNDFGKGAFSATLLLNRHRQLAGCLLLSAVLHIAVLSMLGPVRVSAHASAPARLELHLTDSTKRVTSVVADAASIDGAPAIDGAASSPPFRPSEIAASSQTDPGSPEEATMLQLPIDEQFFKSSELDEQPYPLVTVDPVYPPPAQASNIEGWVRLLLLIDESGELRHLEVIEASPPGIFEEAALAAFRGAPFSPGRRGKEAVKSRMLIKVDFTLENLDKAGSE